MARRGWTVLAVIGATFFVTNALGATYVMGVAVADGDGWVAVQVLGAAAFAAVFWRWITLGAWYRAHPERRPGREPGADGLEEPAPAAMGPWGVVGTILTVGLVVALTGLVIWSVIDEGNATGRAEEVRERADLEARRRGLTVERVAAARAEHLTGSWAATGRPDPYAELLEVAGAEVVDTSVDPDSSVAVVLLRLPGGPPCVAVSVDRNEFVTSAVTQDCG